MGERYRPADREVGRAGDRPDAELDVRDEVCPYTFLKARLALAPRAPGRLLRVIVGNEASARDVPRSLNDAGHAVLAVDPIAPSLWAIMVRKKPEGRSAP